MNLQGKVALVTGASRGIGQAIALELGRQGAIVIGTATSASGAERIAETLKENGIEGAGLVLDVTSDESVATTWSIFSSIFGQPAILVNNAGITRDNLMLRMKDDEWHDVINTNLSSLLSSDQGCSARHDQSALGENYQYWFRGGCHGQRRTGKLRRGQSRA
jgi:3-oxoacyl-[acyl-carrier protein] reductase